MQKLEALQHKVKNAEDLKSIVRSMKIMASVGIRQFENSVDALGHYYENLERGFQIVLSKAFSESLPFLPSDEDRPAGIVVIGSSQPMCGPFDEVILQYAVENIKGEKETKLFVLGDRLSVYLNRAGVPVNKQFDLPGSAGAINALVLDLLAGIEEWQEKDEIGSIRILHNKSLHKNGYKPYTQHLLPLNKGWLKRLLDRPWPTNNLPQFTADAHSLFFALLRQYLFVSLFRSVAESLAAEYLSRLSAMQQAEKKIEERLEKLKKAYSNERQTAITSELLDIMAGFEASQRREND